MENEHVIAGLIRKRAELAGELEAAQHRVRQLVIDLDNIDAAVRIFVPAIDLDEIRPKPLPPRHAAYKGEISRAVLDVLREAGVPLPGAEISLRVMQRRNLNAADPRLRVTVSKRVAACLRNLRIRGAVASAREGREALRWKLGNGPE